MGAKTSNKWIPFFISPFLTLPAVFYGIYRKSAVSLVIFVITMGLISYLYVPYISNDRARYFEFYNDFKQLSWDGFLTQIVRTRADFVLHALIYVSSKLGLPVQLLFQLLTTFTVGTWVYLFNKFCDKHFVSSKYYLLSFLLVLFSFSLPDLFSGIRFYLATAIALLGMFKGLFEKKKNGILFLILACFIHFSAAIFLPIYLCVLFFPEKYTLYRIAFLISFVFILLPKIDLINNINQYLALSGGYKEKADLYLGGEDFIQMGIQTGSKNYIIVYIISVLWVYFSYAYLLITLKRKSNIRNILYLLIFAINIFYQVPTIFSRYLIVLKFIFALVIISEMIWDKQVRPLYFFLVLFGMSFINNIIILRNNFIASLFNEYAATFILVFFKRITVADFLLN